MLCIITSCSTSSSGRNKVSWNKDTRGSFLCWNWELDNETTPVKSITKPKCKKYSSWHGDKLHSKLFIYTNHHNSFSLQIRLQSKETVGIVFCILSQMHHSDLSTFNFMCLWNYVSSQLVAESLIKEQCWGVVFLVSAWWRSKNLNSDCQQLHSLYFSLSRPVYLGAVLGRNGPRWRGFLRVACLRPHPHCSDWALHMGHSSLTPGGFGHNVGGLWFGLWQRMRSYKYIRDVIGATHKRRRVWVGNYEQDNGSPERKNNG